MLDVANQVDWVILIPDLPVNQFKPELTARLTQVYLFQFYRPLNVRIALTGLEIWSDRDKILVEKSPTDTLNNFLEWRTRELLPRLRHDNAQLVM